MVYAVDTGKRYASSGFLLKMEWIYPPPGSGFSFYWAAWLLYC